MSSTRRRRGEDGDETAVAMQLEVLPPFDWDHLLAFLATHAIPGVERVKDGRYQHTFGDGMVTVARESETALRVTVAPALRHAEDVADLLQRLRALFDVEAHPQSIAARLALDARLAPSLAQRPGLRVPGAFDAFELAVRTILGQQVSVRGGSTLSGRFVAAYGKKLAAAVAVEAGEAHPLTHLFPTPKKIAKLDPEAVAKVVGMPIPRGRAIVALARGMVHWHGRSVTGIRSARARRRVARAAGRGPLDERVHRHAGGALGGCVSRRGSGAEEAPRGRHGEAGDGLGRTAASVPLLRRHAPVGLAVNERAPR